LILDEPRRDRSVSVNRVDARPNADGSDNEAAWSDFGEIGRGAAARQICGDICERLGPAVEQLFRNVRFQAARQNAIEAEVPAGKVIHAVLDNYAVHKHPKVRAWLGRHPRWVVHFTPTSASWLNAVEGFFAKLTKRRLKPGVFKSIVDLQAAINRFLAETNDAPRPFTWTADPDNIIAAVRRGHQALDSVR
jgi:transposase